MPTTSRLDAALGAAPTGPGLKGTISDSVTGKPLAGVQVRLWLLNATNTALIATSGADGRYTIPSVAAGQYQLDVAPSGYRDRWFTDSATRAGSTTITISGSCSTTPDPTWGDPCLTPASVRTSSS